MQLICNNTVLDLYDDASLQFKHTNPLFAFDKMTCERTTQFKLPCTPTNDRVLLLARIPAYAGAGMRRRFGAQLQAGTLVRDGYLYVSDFDGKDYTAIFVTGELLGLQAIKNAGKLRDLVSLSDYVTASAIGTTPSLNVGTLWANVSYKKENSTDLLHPSIELQSLYDALCNALNVQSQSIPAAAAKVRIVAGKLKGVEANGVQFTGGASAMADDQTSFPICYQIDLDKYDELFTIETAKVLRRVGDRTPYIYYSGSVQQYVAKQDVEIKFPDDWDDDLFVGYFLDGETWFQNEFQFLGDRSFTAVYGSGGATYTISGESLRGRTIALAQGDKFVFISKYDYIFEDSSSGTEQGWMPEDCSCEFSLTSKADQEGAVIYLQDNLPDITFVELLKTIAALSGCVLNYTDEDGITFEDLNTSAYDVDILSAIIKRGEVLRTFSDYAQRNLVLFNDDANNLGIEYTIDNDNLQAENELQKIPFAEGNSFEGFLYIPADEERYILGANNGGAYLEQVALIKCAGLQGLCDKSTQFKIEARMSLQAHENMSAKTLIQVDGTRYVWTERVWQKDTAQFTLAKIA